MTEDTNAGVTVVVTEAAFLMCVRARLSAAVKGFSCLFSGVGSGYCILCGQPQCPPRTRRRN